MNRSDMYVTVTLLFANICPILFLLHPIFQILLIVFYDLRDQMMAVFMVHGWKNSNQFSAKMKFHPVQ
jgi:hypothetical protein